ncbi:MAG TPA: c-type cytochrome [Pirellulaceae bacterium]|nr:c-type cytochrome [Pirellulaceae bacterium]
MAMLDFLLTSARRWPATRAVLIALVAVSIARANARAAEAEVDNVVTLLEFVIDVDQETAAKCLETLRAAVQSGEIDQARLATVRKQLGEKFAAILAAGPENPLYMDVALVAGSWGDTRAVEALQELVSTPDSGEEERLAALDALAATRGSRLLALAPDLLVEPNASSTFVSRVLTSLGRYDAPSVADIVLKSYPRLAANVQPRAIELLTQRPSWSKRLIESIGKESLPTSVLSANQVARLQASRDAELVELVRTRWGTVRTERNPQRTQVIGDIRELLTSTIGDPLRGQLVFNKVCGQCHKIYGQGQEVGPDITRNGRASFDQLLSNVFDPSLVIGAAYQARTVITTEGRVLTGLVAEDNEQRLVLKIQGGKQEVVPRDKVDEVVVSKLSLMPEDLEKQLKPQELVDLFQFLTLDHAPQDPQAALIPGAPEKAH